MRVAIGVLPMLIIILGIPVLIGVYVYRDARRRNMDAALWTLVTMLAPVFIGFIIYLLVRGNYSDLKCARCSTTVKEQYVVCPKCGVKLRPTCGSCGTPVEADWSICPKCAQPLSQDGDIAAPVRPKDNVLWKILVAVIVIPVLLIIFLLVAFSAVSQSGGTTVMSITCEDYFAQQHNGDVKEWFQGLDKDYDTAYVLRYVPKEGAQDVYEEDETCYYLLYVPAAGMETNLGFGYQGGLFQDSFVVDMENCTMDGSMIYCIAISYEENPKLKVYCNGNELTCKITDVTYNPTIFKLPGEDMDEDYAAEDEWLEEDEIVEYE